jgi:hypothetical protein
MDKELELRRAQQNLAHNEKAGNSDLVTKYKALVSKLKQGASDIHKKSRSWDKHLGTAAQTTGKWSNRATKVANFADTVAKGADYVPIIGKRVKKFAKSVARGARKFAKYAGNVANLSNLGSELMKQIHAK